MFRKGRREGNGKDKAFAGVPLGVGTEKGTAKLRKVEADVFVRWKKRNLKSRCNTARGPMLYCYIAVSERLDGKPRQRIIKYLGAVHEHPTIYSRLSFWRKMDRKVSKLNIDAATMKKLVKEIAGKVPRLRAGQIKKIEEHQAKVLRSAHKVSRVEIEYGRKFD